MVFRKLFAMGYPIRRMVPVRCRKYVDRSLPDRGVIHAGDKVVRAFASVGWARGGTWQGTRD